MEQNINIEKFEETLESLTKIDGVLLVDFKIQVRDNSNSVASKQIVVAPAGERPMER